MTDFKIDYRKCYINYLTRIIEDKLKEIREIVCMPENLIEEKILRENIFVRLKEEK
jgi:hypothetical protein